MVGSQLNVCIFFLCAFVVVGSQNAKMPRAFNRLPRAFDHLPRACNLPPRVCILLSRAFSNYLHVPNLLPRAFDFSRVPSFVWLSPTAVCL